MTIRMNKIHQRCSADHGSSIWELVAAFFIIGILVTLAVQVYQPATAGAKATACQHNRYALTRAIQLVKADTGTPPEELDDLRAYVSNYDTVANCPLTGQTLLLDAASETVSCPGHPAP